MKNGVLWLNQHSLMKWYEKNTAQEKLFHLVIKNKGEYLAIY